PRQSEAVSQTEPAPVFNEAPASETAPAPQQLNDWWSPAPTASEPPQRLATEIASAPTPAPTGIVDPPNQSSAVATEPTPASTFFCGDTSFFSLHRALQTIAKEKLTGSFRAYWDRAPVELLARAGEILFATTRDAGLYCPDAPVTLMNVDP